MNIVSHTGGLTQREIIHQRWGHFSDRMINDNWPEKIPGPKQREQSCDTCSAANLRREPVPKQRLNKPLVVGQELHHDFIPEKWVSRWGEIGSEFLMERTLGYMWVLPIKKQSETPHKTIQVCRRLKNICGRPVREVFSDNHILNKSADMKREMAETGGVLKPNMSGDKESFIESGVKVLKKIVEKIQTFSGTNNFKQSWPKAKITACAIRNHFPLNVLEGKSRAEVLLGRDCSRERAYLLTYGSEARAKDPMDQGGGTYRAVYFGPAFSHDGLVMQRAACMLDLDSGKWKVARSFMVMENKFPFRSSGSS